MSVERVRVGEVLQLVRRSVDVQASVLYREVGLRAFGRGVFHKDPVLGLEIASKRVFWIKPGDLLVSNVFAWEGAVAVATGAEDGMIGSHRFMTFIPNADVNVQFLAHYFASEEGIRRLQAASPGSAGRNRTLGIAAFENIMVPLPDIATQHRIASRLSEMAHVASMVFGANERSLLHLATTRDQLLRSVAHGVRLRELVTRSSEEVHVDPESTYRTAGLLNRGRGLFNRGTIRGSETKYRSFTRLRARQLVYSKLFGWEGSVAVVPDGFDGFMVSPEFPVFVLRDERLAPYLSHVVKSESFVEQMAGSVSGMGQRRQRVNPEQFLDVVIPMPEPDELARLNAILDKVDRASHLIGGRTTVASSLVASAKNAEFATLTS